MENVIYLTPPFTKEKAESLKMGDEVLITGSIYTARDAAHKRLCELISAGKQLPINLHDEIIYYTGPSPAKPGMITGSAGPTTSSRMDAYTPALIQQAGLRGMIGKGGRSAEVITAMKKGSAVYFAAIGGAGALMAASIKKAETVLYPDLGPEAVLKLYVERFPVIVAIDSDGRNLFEEGPAQYKK